MLVAARTGGGGQILLRLRGTTRSRSTGVRGLVCSAGVSEDRINSAAGPCALSLSRPNYANVSHCCGSAVIVSGTETNKGSWRGYIVLTATGAYCGYP